MAAQTIVMLGRNALLAASLVSIFAVGCAPQGTGEDFAASDEALTGNVAIGSIVEVMTDGLRLRRTPSTETSKNIIGLLPKGTKVKILEAAPQGDNFYKVEVVDDGMRTALPASVGWVAGRYLEGDEGVEPRDADEPLDPVEGLIEVRVPVDPPRTGTLEARVRDIVDCSGMKDDEGRDMPSIDDTRTGASDYAALIIESDEFAYGTVATIPEVNQRSTFNMFGEQTTFKIVKRGTARRGGTVMITMCHKYPNAILTLPTSKPTVAYELKPVTLIIQ